MVSLYSIFSYIDASSSLKEADFQNEESITSRVNTSSSKLLHFHWLNTVFRLGMFFLLLLFFLFLFLFFFPSVAGQRSVQVLFCHLCHSSVTHKSQWAWGFKGGAWRWYSLFFFHSSSSLLAGKLPDTSWFGRVKWTRWLTQRQARNPIKPYRIWSFSQCRSYLLSASQKCKQFCHCISRRFLLTSNFTKAIG